MVLNEVAVVKKIIEDGTVGNSIVENTILLVKYYCSIYITDKGRLQRTRVTEKVLTYLKDVVPDYELEDWRDRINKYINRFRNTPLYQVKYIGISQSELDTIRNIENKKLEKIAFVSLVYAKYFDLRNPNNHHYVNVDYQTVFKSARVAGSKFDQPMILHELKELGLVERAKWFNNPNYKVTFIDESMDNVVLKVVDLRELGYQYLRWRDNIPNQFIECAECGVLIRKKSNNTKYCHNCCGYQPITIKTLTCIDCDKEFVVSSSARSKRCPECRHKKQLEYQRISMTKLRSVK